MKRKEEFTDFEGVSPDIYKLIKQLPEVEPSPNFTAAVMSRLKSEKHLENVLNVSDKKPGRWFRPLMPSFGYALVFLIFLGFGLGINQVLDIPKALNGTAGSQVTAGANISISNESNDNITDNIDIAKIFEESQNLRLINVQEQTVALLVNTKNDPSPAEIDPGNNNQSNAGGSHGR